MQCKAVVHTDGVFLYLSHASMMESSDAPLLALRHRLPVPNEIFHEILVDVIFENVHIICMPRTPEFPQWNALTVLPKSAAYSVPHPFTSIQRLFA
jgi:hypothetical protein